MFLSKKICTSMGMALSQWSDQIVRKLELLINSYADAYRMQIHRFRGTSDSAVNPGQLQADLELLRNWRPANSATLTEGDNDCQARADLKTKESCTAAACQD